MGLWVRNILFSITTFYSSRFDSVKLINCHAIFRYRPKNTIPKQAAFIAPRICRRDTRNCSKVSWTFIYFELRVIFYILFRSSNTKIRLKTESFSPQLKLRRKWFTSPANLNAETDKRFRVLEQFRCIIVCFTLSACEIKFY